MQIPRSTVFTRVMLVSVSANILLELGASVIKRESRVSFVIQNQYKNYRGAEKFTLQHFELGAQR